MTRQTMKQPQDAGTSWFYGQTAAGVVCQYIQYRVAL